jgi:taurine transport system ATP-binding protein
MSKLIMRNVELVYPSRKSAEPVKALERLDMAIEGSEFVVVLGPSGCGKTSWLNLLAGFIRPTSGEMLLDGRPIEGPGRDRGVVFQKHGLLPWLSVVGNAAFGLKLQGMPRRERRATAREYLALVGLEEFADQPIYQLSGGMQQRLGIARALASDPEILLMDEPFGALDALTRESMQELILRLFAETKKTIFFITHSVEEALFLSTRLIVMSERPGRILHDEQVGFGRRYLSTGDARGIKSSSDYISKREEILDIVRGESRTVRRAS